MSTSFYTRDELLNLGLATVGDNVRISKKASLYGVEGISIGNHVRIDDFCVISAGPGGIMIGDHVHMAIYSSLQGKGMIKLHDFVSISSRVSIYSSNENYFGETLTNPTIPEKYTRVEHADVELHKHVIVASGALILPGVTLHEGAVVGAMSLVNTDCEAFYIYKGNPAVKFLKRSNKLLELEKALRSDENE